MVRLFLLGALTAAGACSAADYRPEQIWVVDLQSHADELDPLLAPRGVDREELAALTLNQLYVFYDGLPIRFAFGEPEDVGASNYICVRTSESDLLGRALLDVGNTGVEFNCGGDLGIFLDNILTQFDNQRTIPTAEQLSLFLAVILAHEIGHSLGLPHTDGQFGLGDIMNGNGIYDVQRLDYAFIPEHRTLLLENLSHE